MVKTKKDKLAVLMVTKEKAIELLNDYEKLNKTATAKHRNSLADWIEKVYEPFCDECIKENVVDSSFNSYHAAKHVMQKGLEKHVSEIFSKHELGNFKMLSEAAAAAQLKAFNYIDKMKFVEPAEVEISKAPDISGKEVKTNISVHVAYLEDSYGNTDTVVALDSSDDVYVGGLYGKDYKELHFESEFYHLDKWCEENNVSIKKGTVKKEIVF